MGIFLNRRMGIELVEDNGGGIIDQLVSKKSIWP